VKNDRIFTQAFPVQAGLNRQKQADPILVMDHGQLTECVSHEKLLRQDGKYRLFVKIR